MRYKYYFFDFDYTLVNSERGIVGCFMKTMEESVTAALMQELHKMLE